MDVVLWSGPVSSGILAPHLARGWSLVTVGHGAHGGIGSDAFRTWAESLGPDPITQLLPNARRVLLFGFSAAHGAHEVFLRRAAERGDERIVGVCALDAYFEALNDTTPKPGHLAWLSWVLSAPRGRRALITTGHTSAGTHKNGFDSFVPLADALELAPFKSPHIPSPVVPVPLEARRRGNVTWLDFAPDQLTHSEHATKLGPLALASWQFTRGGTLLPLLTATLALLFAAKHD